MLHYNLCVLVLDLGGNLYKKGYSITIFVVLRMLGTVMLMKGYNLQGMYGRNEHRTCSASCSVSAPAISPGTVLYTK